LIESQACKAQSAFDPDLHGMRYRLFIRVNEYVDVGAFVFFVQKCKNVVIATLRNSITAVGNKEVIFLKENLSYRQVLIVLPVREG
jgi:hypothetical protein